MDPTAAHLCPKTKAAIRTYYKGRCQYCGSDGADQVEHIVARARGGLDTLGNATLGCERCNQRKSAIDLDPMFVAIAHARAREAAPRILALVARRIRPPAPLRVARPLVVKEPLVLHSHTNTSWGALAAQSDCAEVAGYMMTSHIARLRDTRKMFSIHRGAKASRDLFISFKAMPDEGMIRVDDVEWHASFGTEREPATDYERRVAARLICRWERVLLDAATEALSSVRLRAASGPPKRKKAA